MFSPIVEMNQDMFWTVVLFCSVILNTALYGWTLIKAAVCFVKDERVPYITPLLYFGEVLDEVAPSNRGLSDPMERVSMDLFLMGVVQLFGSVILLAVIVFAVNWMWLPLILGTGTVGALLLARKAVRIKKSLDEHIKDINAHKAKS